MSDDEDSNWTIELETTLIEGCDFATLRGICKGRPVPSHLRAEVWQICLSVFGRTDQMSGFDELFDMDEQATLREDCQALVDQIGNDEEEKVSVACDLESILTYYCKSQQLHYEHDNGWLELLQPMLALKMSRAELYNVFHSLVAKYIPRDSVRNGKPFHLFRLLLLYHDPELCTFLDTRKITPDMYAEPWLRSLFSSVCDLNVILNMWDVYLQQGDPFLAFFLALVIIVNAKDQLLLMEDSPKQDILDKISTFPSALEAEDIEDFCSLAQYYASKTPQSFRRENIMRNAVLAQYYTLGVSEAVQDYQTPLYGSSSSKHPGGGSGGGDVTVAQALCLPVSVHELLEANMADPLTGDECVRYFLIDCRPAEQYNAGHLPTAFHLDANLMLQNPTEFSTAVQALLAAQRQAMAAGSVAGGEHMCFLGSGREEEDQYVNMVVAHFLQRNSQYVSVARGGYAAVHSVVADNLSDGLTDHHARACIVCNPDAAAEADSGAEICDDFTNGELNFMKQGVKQGAQKLRQMYTESMGEEDSIINKFGKLSLVMKSKSADWKDKMINYIKNEQPQVERHVSSEDRGRRYRNIGNVFTIGDDDEEELGGGSSDEDKRDIVNIETWLNKPEVRHAYQCKELKDSGYTYDAHLLMTTTHLYILREIQHKPGMAYIQARRALGSIVKITSKKRHPELITFKYGSNDDDRGLVIAGADRFYIPKASEATKVIKQLIMKVLDALES